MHRGIQTRPPAPGTGEISRESLVRILEIMDRLARPETLPALLLEIVDVGCDAIVAEAGLLWLHDPDAGELALVVPAADPALRIRADQGLPGRAATERCIVNLSDVGRAELLDPWPPALSGCSPRSALTVPIVGQDRELLGVMQWLGEHPGQFDHHDEWIAPALAAQAAIAIQHAQFTERLLADAVLRKEVAVAKEIQVSTLPRRMPEVPGYDLDGRFLPTDHTGGDLFDVVMLDEQLFLLLGDATGHGFGPALSATQMQAMLRVAFRLGADLDSAYTEVNNQLCEDLPDDRFITAFIGFLDPVRHAVHYHSGGQGPILHWRAAEGRCDWHKPTGFPLGAMPQRQPEPGHTLRLEPGDILALISDGVYEFAAADGSQFGEDGVATVLREHHALPMAELSQRLVDAAFAFGGGTEQADDITLVLAKRGA